MDMKEEVKLEVRLDKYRKIFSEYVSENCDGKGNQRSNVSKEKKEGLVSLKKRIKEMELLVIPTDKSGKLVIETWTAMAFQP